MVTTYEKERLAFYIFINNIVILLEKNQANQDLAPWDTWEEQKSDKVRSVEEYRQWQQMQRQQSEEPEVEPDYFQDMAPTLKKQKKVEIFLCDTFSIQYPSNLANAEVWPGCSV